MTRGNFLSRWSRLKRDGDPAEEGPPPAEDARPALSDEDVESAAYPDRPETPPEPADLDLPDIASLGADSDISAFLRDGVPKALRAAALRRVWSLDPAIRDFRGPVEMDWDFNDPQSIPGFGGSVGAAGGGPVVSARPGTVRTPRPAVAAGEPDAVPQPPAPRKSDEVSAASPAPAPSPEPERPEPLPEASPEPPAEGSGLPAQAATAGRRHGRAAPKIPED